MKKPKIFNVYCDVYGTNLLVILGMPEDKLPKYIEKKYKVKWEYGKLAAGGQFDFSKWPFHMIWIKDGIHKEDFIPKIAHEVLHHIICMAEAKQLPTCSRLDGVIADEPIGYLMEFYMRKILEKL